MGNPTVGRWARAALLAAVVAPVLAGCDVTTYQTAYDKVAPDATGGAKLVVIDKKPVYVSGRDDIRVDIAGSGFASSPKTCPRLAFFFTDDAPGDDEYRPDLPTLAGAGGCTVTSMPANLFAVAGTPGTIRDQQITVRVEAQGDDDVLRASVASTTVRIATPAADGSVPADAAPAATTPTASTPTATTPAPTTPAEPAIPDIPVHCDAAPVSPAGFTWGFDGPNPGYGIVGEQAEIDPSATVDTGGTITWFLWDVDGDGKADAAAKPGGGPLRAAPTASGQSKGCLQAVDDAGRTASHPLSFWYVEPAPKLGAAPLTASPATPKVGDPVTFTPASTPAGAQQVCVIYDGSLPPGDPGNRECRPVGSSFTHTYAAAGRVYVEADYTSAGGADYNYWQQSFVVASPSRGFRAAGAAPRASAARTITLTTPLTAKGRVVALGKVRYVGRNLTTTGAIVAGRMTSGLGKAAKRKVPSGLRFLLDADYAGRFSGRRVLVSADSTGIAGTGTMLARSRTDRRTLVCISVRTDGLTSSGTRWTVLGATGRAARYGGGGTASPLVFGAGAPKGQSARLSLKPAKRRGIGACRSLARYLPKGK